TSTPSSASARGNAALTSAKPPVLARGKISDETNRTRNHASRRKRDRLRITPAFAEPSRHSCSDSAPLAMICVNRGRKRFRVRAPCGPAMQRADVTRIGPTRHNARPEINARDDIMIRQKLLVAAAASLLLAVPAARAQVQVEVAKI